MKTDNLAIIIPSLDPDEKLKKTVASLTEIGFKNIILVNDGSRQENLANFPEEGEGVVLLHHPQNLGKGTALKTAFNYVIQNRPEIKGVITADGDGQHLAKDVLACAEKMLETGKVVLGCRSFSGEDVPARSKFGNNMTVIAMGLFCGVKISDTQTGLRAIPTEFLPLLTEVKGSRFEYETNMLISFKQNAIPFCEQKIQTVYIEENKTSHFRPLADSVRIYRFIIAYVFSSLSSALVDQVAFFILLQFITGGEMRLLTCTVLARAISSITNFLINKNCVFSNKGSVVKGIAKYYALAIPQMLVSAGLVYLLNWLAGLAGIFQTNIVVTLIKLVVDTVLFFVSYRVQQNWVFSGNKKAKKK